MRGNADFPREQPAPGNPDAARAPQNAVVPGPVEHKEKGENSTTYKDGDDHITDTYVYVRGTQHITVLTHYNWYYKGGELGSVTTYQVNQNGNITTTITTYGNSWGDVKSKESWTTDSKGIVSHSDSTMFPDGSENNDSNIAIIRDSYTTRTSWAGGQSEGNGGTRLLANEYLNGIKNTPSGWSVAIFGGADPVQGYSSNTLTSRTGSSYAENNDTLGSYGGFSFEYRTRPISFDYLDFCDYCGFTDERYWHYCDECDDWYYDPTERPRVYDPESDEYHESSYLTFMNAVRQIMNNPPPVQVGFGGQFSYNGTMLNQSFSDFSSRSSMDSLTVLGTAKVYFDVTPRLRPYAVLGGGFSYIDNRTTLTQGTDMTRLGSDSEFAPTLMGGVGCEYDVCRHFTAFAEYDHVVQFGTDFRYNAVGGTNYDEKLGDASHDLFSFGMRYWFGR